MKILDPLAMFRRQAQRLSQTQRAGLQRPALPRPALGLVGGNHHMAGALAQQPGKLMVGCGQPGAGINHEQADVGHVDGPFAQPPHPALKAVPGGLFNPCRVNHRKAQIAQPCRALAQVTGDAGPVIDQRQALADKTVEQRGLAHIGPPDDGKGERHLWPEHCKMTSEYWRIAGQPVRPVARPGSARPAPRRALRFRRAGRCPHHSCETITHISAGPGHHARALFNGKAATGL